MISVAEFLGLDPLGMWRLAWLLFFVRLTLGFFLGIDDVLHGFKALRPDRAFGPHVVRNHHIALRRSLRFLRKDGFRQVEHLEGEGAKGVTAPVSIEATGVVIDRPAK